jgi:hypothetical protein
MPRSGEPTGCGSAIAAAHACAARARKQGERVRFFAEMQEIAISCGFLNIRHEHLNASESDCGVHAQR